MPEKLPCFLSILQDHPIFRIEAEQLKLYN